MSVVTDRPGADTYPGVLHDLSEDEFELALTGAQNWLIRSGNRREPYPLDEAWKVWNSINALYPGGMTAFGDRVRELASILRVG